MVEGGQNIAAIVLETVVGTNGILVPPDGYLQGVRELCDDHGIVMIADEVMAGFGRCGEWFAVDRWGVTPDLICFAKGVNSGYIPLGGVIISRPIADTFAERVVPRRADVLRPPAGLRLGRRQHQHLQGGGHHRARPPPRRRRRRPGAGGDRRAPPVGRRGARARRVLGHRAGPRPGDPRAARAVQRRRRRQQADGRPRRGVQGSAGCGRSPTSTGCTSCRRSRSATTTCAAGLAIIDEALAVADEHAD